VRSLLIKKYQKCKSKKKFGPKKEKKKIVKEKRREKRKGAHKEHPVALLFAVPFALSIFPLLPFILISLPCLSQLLLGTCIGQQLGQVLWTFIQYCYLLLTCVPYINYFSLCASQAPHILQISTEKEPYNLSDTSSQVSQISHRLYRPLLYVGKNLVRTC